MRKLFLFIWVVFVIIFEFGKINAQCQCAVVPGGDHYTPHKALKTSDIVFTGEIIEIQKGSTPNEEKVKFKIKSVWKLDVGETITLVTSRTSCGFFGNVWDKYLIYAYKYKDEFTTNGCTRTTSLEKATKDLKEFEEKGEKPIKTYE